MNGAKNPTAGISFEITSRTNWRSKIRRTEEFVLALISTVFDTLSTTTQSFINTYSIWDQRVLLLNFKERIVNINAEGCADTSKRLRFTVNNKRSGKLTRNIIIVHHIARFYFIRTGQYLLTRMLWGVLDHPLNAADLFPSDLHVFGLLL